MHLVQILQASKHYNASKGGSSIPSLSLDKSFQRVNFCVDLLLGAVQLSMALVLFCISSKVFSGTL